MSECTTATTGPDEITQTKQTKVLPKPFSIEAIISKESSVETQQNTSSEKLSPATSFNHLLNQLSTVDQHQKQTNFYAHAQVAQISAAMQHFYHHPWMQAAALGHYNRAVFEQSLPGLYLDPSSLAVAAAAVQGATGFNTTNVNNNNNNSVDEQNLFNAAAVFRSASSAGDSRAGDLSPNRVDGRRDLNRDQNDLLSDDESIDGCSDDHRSCSLSPTVHDLSGKNNRMYLFLTNLYNIQIKFFI